MARTKKQIDIPAAEAKFILESMYRDGVIVKKTLDEYRGRLKQEITTLETQLARLRSLAGPMLVGAAFAAAPAAVRALRGPAKRAAQKIQRVVKKKESPERIASRQLQGRYLGLMRQIPKNIVKQRFGKDTIKEKGKETVVDEMVAYLANSKGNAGRTAPKRRRK